MHVQVVHDTSIGGAPPSGLERNCNFDHRARDRCTMPMTRARALVVVDVAGAIARSEQSSMMIRDIRSADLPALLALNNARAAEVMHSRWTLWRPWSPSGSTRAWSR